MAQRTTPLTKENAESFLDSIDAFLLDCDGVLWEGSRTFPGIPETLEWLRSRGKKLCFVSNNSRTSRAEYQKKMNALGIKADVGEIFSSSYAAALYVSKLPSPQKAYIIGGPGIGEELALLSIPSLHSDVHARPIKSTTEATAEIHASDDPTITVVVVGLDFDISYLKFAYAKNLLDRGCRFVATNTDDTLPAEGMELPGGGCMVRFLETCARRPPDEVVGKPNQTFLEAILSALDLDRSRTCMVGDKLSTDILFGNNGGLSTLLVFTGVTSKADLAAPTNETHPTFTIEALADLRNLVTGKGN
ncbi:HAD-like domain-containing protein [Hyaloraphidium curvatum]|nr:HAD-like domain-containing protein [Hyaloraphidium curvatum]